MDKDKKAKKKPMFVIKETLVHLTPEQMGQVQGGAGCVRPSCFDPYTCYYTY